MAVLDLISHVYLPSFVNKLPKYLKHSTFSSCFWSITIVTGDANNIIRNKFNDDGIGIALCFFTDGDEKSTKTYNIKGNHLEYQVYRDLTESDRESVN